MPACRSPTARLRPRSPPVFPDAQPRSGCTQGCAATRDAWRPLFPHLTLGLCFLPALLTLTERCRGPLRRQVLDRAWAVSHALTKAQCAQRLRRVAEWARTSRDGAVAQTMAKRARHRADVTPAYDCPQAARTPTAVDRGHNPLDRVLSALPDCHAPQASARWAVRAWALQWHFPPYGPRLRHNQPTRSSPVADLNGVPYPPTWLPTLLGASSMGGLRL